MPHPTSIKGVLLIDGQVLLVKNARDEWELPGGRIEPGEEHPKALAREFAEELSIDVAASTPIDSYLFEVIPGHHVFIVTYGCMLLREFRPAISHEHTEHCLWPVDRLSELRLPVVTDVQLRNGRRRSNQSMKPTARRYAAGRK
jgi:8-oxo-dGTP pyrophosphatase MutT (NUDIX family)